MLLLLSASILWAFFSSFQVNLAQPVPPQLSSCTCSVRKLWGSVAHVLPAGCQMPFLVLSSSTPVYLNDLIQSAVPVRPLRSSDAPMLSAARTRTEFAQRALSVAAPHLPGTHYRLTLDLVTLYTPLKTPQNTPV